MQKAIGAIQESAWERCKMVGVRLAGLAVCVWLAGQWGQDSLVASAAEPIPGLWGSWSLREGLSSAVPGRPAAQPSPSELPLKFDVREGVPFNGRDQWLTIAADNAPWQQGDFTIGVSVHTDLSLDDDLGDVLSAWNAAKRTGWTLALRNNSGCTSSQSNARHLEFGIDQTSEPSWQDEGRPGQSLYGFALCAHAGELYVSTCEPGTDQSGRVYRYRGPGDWVDLGPLDGTNAVTALASYRGQLYAGTGKYRLAGSSLPESENAKLGGRVYRLGAEDRWELVGELPETEAIAALAEYQGQLHATSLYRPAGFFRWEADGTWARLPSPNGKRTNAVRVHDGHLYATSYDSGAVYRWDGRDWTDLGVLQENTQTYSFTTFGNRLHVGTWPAGTMVRLDPGDQWHVTGRLGEELEVMAQLVHNGCLYAGTLPLGEVYRFDGQDQWTRLKQIDTTPDVKYRRVWTMASFGGKLFATTLPSGNVWSMQTGTVAAWDHEFPTGWQHVMAQRAGNELRLWVNGKLVSSAQGAAAWNLQHAGPLQIGSGPAAAFNGRLRDVQIFDRALSAEEIHQVSRPQP
jgi:hypothetical protein